LSRGLLGGRWRSGPFAPGDVRHRMPRFQGKNAEANLRLVEALDRVAAARGVTVAQIAIAWVAAQGADIAPLIGTKQRGRLTEALQAPTLTPVDIAAIEGALPPGAASGARYGEAQLVMLDSER
jgi:aryl-alcohol dehydrogenase-like predicted oxidoreductase